jgi:hypothetical protein
MSKNHTLLEDFGPAVIHALSEGKCRYLVEGGRFAVASSSPPNNPPRGKSASLPPPNPPNRKFAAAALPPHDPSIIKYLLALGAGGAGGYALRDKLGDAADEAGEHINSLRDKLANIVAVHHDA